MKEIVKEFGTPIETEYETKQPICVMSINYHKGGAGYLSYYYLTMMEEAHCHSKALGFDSRQCKVFENMNTDVILAIVKRKSAKIEALLNKWLEENADKLMQCWLFGMSRNMRHVFNFIKANALPEFDGLKYNRPMNMPGIELLPPDYYAKTDAWWKLQSVTTIAELDAFVQHFMSEHETYEAWTELYVCLSWSCDLLFSKDKDLAYAFSDKAAWLQDEFYTVFKDNKDAQNYFFEITD